MFRKNGITSEMNVRSFFLILFAFFAIIFLSYFGKLGLFAAIFFLYFILALFRFEIALLIYIPIIILNYFDILNFAEVAFRGLNLQTLLVAPLLISFLGQLVTGRIELQHKNVGKTQIVYFLFFLVVPFLWGFVKDGSFVLPSFDYLIELKGTVFTYILFCFCLYANITKKGARLFISTWLIISAVLAVRGLYFYFNNDSYIWAINRLVATGSRYNIVSGSNITAGLFFSISFVSLLTEKKYRFIYGCLALLFFFESILSYYRSAIVMILIIVVINLLVVNNFKRKAFFYIPVSIILLFIISPASIWERVGNTFEFGRTTNSEFQVDTTGRLEYYWPKAVDKAVDSFPIGAGFMYKESSFNTYLNWLVRYGLLGLVLGFWLTWRIAKDLWAIKSKEEMSESRGMIYALSVSLFSFWIGIQFRGLTGDITYAFWTTPFYFLLGILFNFHYSSILHKNDKNFVDL